MTKDRSLILKINPLLRKDVDTEVGVEQDEKDKVLVVEVQLLNELF